MMRVNNINISNYVQRLTINNKQKCVRENQEESKIMYLM